MRECARSSSFADILVGVNAEIDEAETAEAHVVRPNLILDGSILNTHCAKPTAASRRPQADGRCCLLYIAVRRKRMLILTKRAL